MRNERRKRIELDFDRKAWIFELKMRQRVLRGEFGRRDAAQPRGILRAQAVLTFERRQNPCFQNARDWLGIPHLDPNGRKRKLRSKSLVRSIENLPIAQL